MIRPTTQRTPNQAPKHAARTKQPMIRNEITVNGMSSHSFIATVTG